MVQMNGFGHLGQSMNNNNTTGLNTNQYTQQEQQEPGQGQQDYQINSNSQFNSFQLQFIPTQINLQSPLNSWQQQEYQQHLQQLQWYQQQQQVPPINNNPIYQQSFNNFNNDFNNIPNYQQSLPQQNFYNESYQYPIYDQSLTSLTPSESSHLSLPPPVPVSESDDDDLIILDKGKVVNTRESSIDHLIPITPKKKQVSAKAKKVEMKDTKVDMKKVDTKKIDTKPISKLTPDLKSDEDRKRQSPAEVIASIRKKPKTVNSQSSDTKFEQELSNLSHSFEKDIDVMTPFKKIILDNITFFKTDRDKLADRLAKILFAIPESLYARKPDYRYEGWKYLMQLINDKSFWVPSNTSIAKILLRVRNWMIRDMKLKNFDGILESLQLLSEIKLKKENLETFKIWPNLLKFQKMEKHPKIKKLAVEIMSVDTPIPKKSPQEKPKLILPTSSVMKSLSAANTKKIDVKPVITRSSIFINDPNKSKKENEKPIDSTLTQPQDSTQTKPLKKVWALSDYLTKASQRTQTQLQQQQQQLFEDAKPDADADEKTPVGEGLFSILRRKNADDQLRKRRKALSQGVRFKDHDLVSVKIISGYDRSANKVNLSDSGSEGFGVMGVTDDEDVEWSEPVLYQVSQLPWFELDLFEENPTFRGGEQDFPSQDAQDQLDRNARVPEVKYEFVKKVPFSPSEPDTLKVLPPRIVEVKMAPFGISGV